MNMQEDSEILIADCAQAFIDDHGRTEYLGTTSSLMSDIQELGISSPPEQLWYVAAVACGLHNWATINPQYPIGNYRVDFMIDPIGYFVNHPFELFPFALQVALSRLMTKFVVEIDGFEWHDKTPAQAEQDKRRERLIQQKGYRLFRYAAREVLRDPRQCVSEIDGLVLTEVRQACASLTLKHIVRTKKYDETFEGLED